MKFSIKHKTNKKERKETRDKERVIHALASRLVHGNLRDSEKVKTIERLRSIV